MREQPSDADMCPGGTYLSWGVDGDDGPWIVTAECDGPPSCGYYRLLGSHAEPTAGGIDSSEIGALHAEHQAHRAKKARPPQNGPSGEGERMTT